MVNELTRENFEKVIRTHSIVVVEFYSATCKHCKKLEAGITELSEEIGNDVYFGKVQIPNELSLADEYEISSVPTLLYFKDGEIREKSVGFTHKLIIAENIKKL
ncbi:thioredoxin domain-containing protein [uncultured Eubacterium sp.]|uniref:thioredoxin family protein n=1 Tax=uncultured Eubacterium sp. TaxID=165185 RepID=UPI0025FDCCAE|nr:thioredoxin domain-containing protein [uncultured Eubacterium sp.]